MTHEIIQAAKDRLADYDCVELFARGKTFAAREQLKYLGFEFLAHDREWRIRVKKVASDGCLSCGPTTINSDELAAMEAAGVEFSVE